MPGGFYRSFQYERMPCVFRDHDVSIRQRTTATELTSNMIIIADVDPYREFHQSGLDW